MVAAVLVLGFLLISACKAGVVIAEFSTVGRMCGQSSALGFACVVLAKHALGVLMTWGVPLVLETTDGGIQGISRVQLVLLIPHALSMIAGIGLARMCPLDSAELDGVPEANGGGGSGGAWESRAGDEAGGGAGILRAPVTPPGRNNFKNCDFVASPAAGSALSRIGSLLGLSSQVDNANERKAGGADSAAAAAAIFRVTMIGLWRALAVGTLHAYHSIRIKFMQSRGLQLTEAGTLFATYDGIGIALLPWIALLCRVTGLKPMLALVPLVSVVAMGGVALCAGDGTPVRASLLVLSVMEVFVPIIPLALLPANSGRLGAAFGAIELMFITIQMLIAFLIGFARTAGGGSYAGALQLIIGSFLAVLALSLPVILHGRDYPRLPRAFYVCSTY